MQRHDLDPVALVAGVAFVGIGLASLLRQVADAPIRWLLPVLLIVVGIAGLFASRTGSSRSD